MFADNSNGYTIIVGNGSNDFVSADFSSHDKITLGNGAGDTVSGFDSSNDTISLGNGDRDTVCADCSNHDRITLGNGSGDRVDAFGGASQGHAGSVNLATGLDSGGVLQTTGDALDANWQVTGAVNPKSPPSAFVVGTTSADAGFGGGWIANGPNSSWIAANPDDIVGNGLETFTRTFTVTDPSTAAIINGAWTIDDGGSLFLNGHLLSTLPYFNGPVLTHTTLLNAFTTAPSDFVVGVNTLTMVTTSTDDFIEGARLEGMLTNTVDFDKIILGDGAGDTVNASSNDTITLGNGNNDTVTATFAPDATITVGNGNDTIYVGRDNTVTVGTGQDSFIFQQTTPGNIGAVTVTGFDPGKDSFTFSTQLTTSVSYHDNAQGNAVVTVDNSGDTIPLVGVHASELHPSDFHFVDPAAAPASPSPAQQLAEHHASFLL